MYSFYTFDFFGKELDGNHAIIVCGVITDKMKGRKVSLQCERIPLSRMREKALFHRFLSSQHCLSELFYFFNKNILMLLCCF